MKLEEIGAILVIALLCALASWIIWSFAFWNIDPRAWNNLARFMAVMMAGWFYLKVAGRGSE